MYIPSTSPVAGVMGPGEDPVVTLAITIQWTVKSNISILDNSNISK